MDDLKDQGEKRPVPNPCRTFLEAFEHYPEIMENIVRVGFTKPTAIQVQRLIIFMLLFSTAARHIKTPKKVLINDGRSTTVFPLQSFLIVTFSSVL